MFLEGIPKTRFRFWVQKYQEQQSRLAVNTPTNPKYPYVKPVQNKHKQSKYVYKTKGMRRGRLAESYMI